MTMDGSTKKTCFTFELTDPQQQQLYGIVLAGNYRERKVPYAAWSAAGDKVGITLYEKVSHGKRKLCVQGAGAEDFVLFTLEPQVLGAASLGYERELNPELFAPHAGSDESGKGDYFGPLVVCTAFSDERLMTRMRELGVKDCKQMTDKAVLATGAALRQLLGENGYAVVKLGPPAYNRLYAKMKNINRMLAWAHAMAIEELLTKRSDCKRVVVDQFAPTEATIARALKPLGKAAEVVQRHKAEDDIAVAAASVIAREVFLRECQKMAAEMFPGDPEARTPTGSSDPRVEALAAAQVRVHGPTWLMNHVKAHFRTTDKVLSECGLDRNSLPEEGRIVSTAARASGQKKED